MKIVSKANFNSFPQTNNDFDEFLQNNETKKNFESKNLTFFSNNFFMDPNFGSTLPLKYLQVFIPLKRDHTISKPHSYQLSHQKYTT